MFTTLALTLVITVHLLPTLVSSHCLLSDGRYIEETNAVSCIDSPTGLCICCGQSLIPFSGAQSPVGTNWCCNGNPFNTNNQVCCGAGAWLGDTCCGAIGYDSHNQFCCAGQLGDTHSQTCCNGRVTARATPHGVDQCCDSTAYDTGVQVCCSGRIYNGQSCCGFSAINPLTQQCCGGKPVYRSSAFSQCCGQSSYNPQTQVCCNGRVLGTGNACCGSNPYDASRQICCSNQISWLPRGSGRCCGTQSYSALSQSCCGGAVVNAPTCYVQTFGVRERGRVVIQQQAVFVPRPPRVHPTVVVVPPQPAVLPVFVPQPQPALPVFIPQPPPAPLIVRPVAEAISHSHVGHGVVAVPVHPPQVAVVQAVLPPNVVVTGLTNGSGLRGNPIVIGQQQTAFLLPWQKQKAAREKAAAAKAAARKTTR